MLSARDNGSAWWQPKMHENGAPSHGKASQRWWHFWYSWEGWSFLQWGVRNAAIRGETCLVLRISIGSQRMTRGLVVLDLNGAILDAAKVLVRDPNGRPIPYLAKTRSKYIYLRPGAHAFLRWLVDHFDVGIWTSCIERNAHDIVKVAVPHDLQKRLKFVYHRGHCELLPGPGYRTIKDLRRVWKRWPQYGPRNTWAVDDTADKYRYQPENLLTLAEYRATRQDDSELHKLRVRLTPLICKPLETDAGSFANSPHEDVSIRAAPAAAEHADGVGVFGASSAHRLPICDEAHQAQVGQLRRGPHAK